MAISWWIPVHPCFHPECCSGPYNGSKCAYFENLVELYPLPPSKSCLKFLLQSWWAMYSLTTYHCAVLLKPQLTHSSLIQQKLVSILKLPLWNFPLKNTIFSVLLFSTYLLTSGNVSKRSFRKLLYIHLGQGEYIYWKVWILPHGEQMRAINPGNSQSENTL